MSETLIKKKSFSTTSFQADATTYMKIGNIEYQAATTYDISFDKSKNNLTDFIINRTNFKLNGEEVEAKFVFISNEYFKTIFPIAFKVEDSQLKVTNYNEIINRILDADFGLKAKHEGEGFDYIREQFLEKVMSQAQFQNFISQLPIVKILELSLQSDKNKYEMKWMINPIGFTHWNGAIAYKKETNSVSFIPSMVQEEVFLDAIKRYANENSLMLDIDKEESISNFKFSNTLEYLENSDTLKTSVTEVHISIGNQFEYKETFILN